MRLVVLADNVAGRRCIAEHGLSFYIEADKKILLDTGSSDLFMQNAQRLNIDVENVDAVVLSHGHDDHTGGLTYLNGLDVVAHSEVFMKRYRKRNKTPLHLPMSKEECSSRFNLTLSDKPLWLSEEIVFLGEIPRLNDFEAKETAFLDKEGNDDFVIDDSGIAVKTKKGLVVVSGCAHAGICNMTEYAKEVTGMDDVYAVVGGFHLMGNDELTSKTVDYFKQIGVEKVIPGHCTSFIAQQEIYQSFPFQQVKTGNTIVF
ncbi:MBL fold metallo-hydrolase [Puteibacter caeruleilacunae]|nr:MBL fold metallo-hydrolase [Puteibacter caeruleilacunae]